MTRYGRRVVWQGKLFGIKLEVVMIEWHHKSKTRVHDHGSAVGYNTHSTIIVLKGSVWEQCKGVDVKNRYLKGEVIHVHSATIHQMGNDRKRRAVTLHINIPPLPKDAMTVREE